MKVKQMTLLMYLALSSMFLPLAASADDSQIEKLQRQLSARDTAMLDMQNLLDSQGQTIRSLQGSLEDLTIKFNQLNDKYTKLQSELDAIKNSSIAPATTSPTNANSSNASGQVQPQTPVNVAQATPVAATTTVPTQASGKNDNQASVKPSASQSADTEQSAYDAAYAFVRNNQLAEADKAFLSFIKKYPESSLVPNAYYWLGQIAYSEKKYEQAKEYFLNVTKYKTSQKRADSIYKLGQITEQQKDNAKAKKYYQLVIKSYPNTTEAILAKKAMDALK